jgi:hypothetical protein
MNGNSVDRPPEERLHALARANEALGRSTSVSLAESTDG